MRLPTVVQLDLAAGEPVPDPFAACLWPTCETPQQKDSFFCIDHKRHAPASIVVKLRGAVKEGNLEAWRKACAELRGFASQHG